MAASAWAFYNMFKEYMADGTIDLDTSVFHMALYLSSSNAGTVTNSTRTQLTNEVANSNGYATGGKQLSGVTWGQGASAGERRWDATAKIWSASGGSISGVKYAVIYQSGASAGAQKLVCYSQLSTAAFSITDGNTLTITPSANGIFELN